MENDKINILELQAKAAQIALDLSKTPKPTEASKIIDLALLLTHALQAIADLQKQVAALQLQCASQANQ